MICPMGSTAMGLRWEHGSSVTLARPACHNTRKDSLRWRQSGDRLAAYEAARPPATLWGGFGRVEIMEAVAEQAVQLRREHRLRLPDAIILASARVEQCLLVTRNTRDFKPAGPDIRVPYVR